MDRKVKKENTAEKTENNHETKTPTKDADKSLKPTGKALKKKAKNKAALKKAAEAAASGSNTKANDKQQAATPNKGTEGQQGKVATPNKTTENQKSKGNNAIKGSGTGKKETLGGMIFMCNSQTKDDCFLYQVMGQSSAKADIVMQVRPKMKLFLYDIGSRLMYGVFQAASSGSMRLEPKAFGGQYPAQVRFSVLKDCPPLQERSFIKALKTNQDTPRKFEIELSVTQANKLTQIFVEEAAKQVTTALPSLQHGGLPASVKPHTGTVADGRIAPPLVQNTPHMIPHDLYTRSSDGYVHTRLPVDPYEQERVLLRNQVMDPLYMNRASIPSSLAYAQLSGSGLDPGLRDRYLLPALKEQAAVGSYTLDPRQSGYTQMALRQGPNPEAVLPVGSRYAFQGPSSRY